MCPTHMYAIRTYFNKFVINDFMIFFVISTGIRERQDQE